MRADWIKLLGPKCCHLFVLFVSDSKFSARMMYVLYLCQLAAEMPPPAGSVIAVLIETGPMTQIDGKLAYASI